MMINKIGASISFNGVKIREGDDITRKSVDMLFNTKLRKRAFEASLKKLNKTAGDKDLFISLSNQKKSEMTGEKYYSVNITDKYYHGYVDIYLSQDDGPIGISQTLSILNEMLKKRLE